MSIKEILEMLSLWVVSTVSTYLSFEIPSSIIGLTLLTYSVLLRMTMIGSLSADRTTICLCFLSLFNKYYLCLHIC